MKRWEYETFNYKVSDLQLNDLGKVGWELVSHSVVVSLREIYQYYVFKREIEGEEK